MAKKFFYVCAGVFLLAASSTVAYADDLLPYGATGYRYCICAPSEAMFHPSFDDSSWPIGSAAFGSAGGCSPPNIQTEVRAQTVLRRHFMLSGTPVEPQLRLSYAGQITVYINGYHIATLIQSSCTHLNDAIISLGTNVLVSGDNVIAVACDFGWVGTFGSPYCDLSLTGAGATIVEKTEWGAVKQRYR